MTGRFPRTCLKCGAPADPFVCPEHKHLYASEPALMGDECPCIPCRSGMTHIMGCLKTEGEKP